LTGLELAPLIVYWLVTITILCLILELVDKYLDLED